MTAFVGMRDRTSGIIRGQQIASRVLGWKFIDVRDAASLAQLKDEVVFFIRNIDTSITQALRNQGCRIGYDLLDRPVADHHDAWKRGIQGDLDWHRYDHPCIDFFLVNNTESLTQLRKVTGKPIYVVPHHTVNFSRHRNELKQRVETVGYLGTSDQMLLQDETRSMCEKHGARFVCFHPNTQVECDAALRSIDVGVIYVEPTEHRDFVLKHKPNTKLSNFQSYGIPTVASRYSSFIEFGGQANHAWQLEEDPDGFLNKLEMLLMSKNLREWTSDAAHIVGQEFHIDHVLERYSAVLAVEGLR